MIEALWLVLRAAGLVLPLQAAGTAVFSAVFAAHLARCAPAIRRLGLRVALLGLAVLGAQALLQPVYLAGEWSGLADADLVRVFLGSSVAAALAARLLGLTAVAVGLWRQRAQPVALAGSLAIAGSFLLTGHTTVHAQRVLLAALLLVHVAIVAFWLGALWPLRQATALETPTAAAGALAGFSKVAVALVPLIAVAGAALALVLLPDAAALRRPYGWLLLAKVALFALLMGLAALNRLRLAPALARAQATAAVQLRRSIALEYALIAAALAVTAVMTGKFSPAPD
jgi:copper resistance protein D